MKDETQGADARTAFVSSDAKDIGSRACNGLQTSNLAVLSLEHGCYHNQLLRFFRLGNTLIL